uniref:Large ribosomal subunit protein bL33c n=1 Tax=Pelargonium trifidum TaxID=122198 RepID=A0A1B0PXR7_9ROSI|nr:ribosomal protein L33 [Pelargonium trifidum]YP_009299968.1 ribosomal protein L33 [Pelargonium trifidum]AJB99821.1 ribosomal protein L33 [Pelargonium trifidum]AJB99883.1 ribosomal protein L33 [Pelargonium trifidum]
MTKGKDKRRGVTLECTICIQNKTKKSPGIYRYVTQKNPKNTRDLLELRKFCPICQKHTLHLELTI